MTFKLSNYKQFLIFFLALLPLQLTLRLVMHLPTFLMLIYVFLLLSGIYYIILPKFYKKISQIQFYTSLILFVFFIEMVISVLFNYTDILDKQIPFQYYVSKYSPFWDSSIMSSLFAGIIRPLVYFLFCFLNFFILNSKNSLNNLCKYLIIIGFISSLYSIYQVIAYYLGLPFDALFSGHDGNIITQMGFRRCEGIFYEPGPHATYLSTIFCLLIYQFNINDKSDLIFKKKFVLITIFLTIFIALFLTFSPIGMLTPFIALLIFLITNWKCFSKKIKYSVIGILISLFLVCSTLGNLGNNKITYADYLIKRITALQSNSAIMHGDARSVRNEIGYKIAKTHFWLGVGAGNDGFYYSQLAPYAIGNLPDKGIVLNNNLKILTDSGIFGFICYIILLIFPFMYFYNQKFYKYKNDIYLVNLTCSLFLAILLFVVLTFNSQVEFFQPLFWIIYSMLIASINILKKEKNIRKLKEI